MSDGKEHTVTLTRYENNAKLVVDVGEGSRVTGSAASKELNLGANPELHFGGIPKDSQYYG